MLIDCKVLLNGVYRVPDHVIKMISDAKMIHKPVIFLSFTENIQFYQNMLRDSSNFS